MRTTVLNLDARLDAIGLLDATKNLCKNKKRMVEKNPERFQEILEEIKDLSLEDLTSRSIRARVEVRQKRTKAWKDEIAIAELFTLAGDSEGLVYQAPLPMNLNELSLV